ncbi:MAG: amino acid permease C-terminal domain-containing protein, partial [Bacteroidota bacterium]
LTTVIVTIMAVVKSWSFIPVIGLLTNFYLMSELGITNWTRFGVWLVIGLLLYFSYGIFHSKLDESKETVV